MDKIVSKFNGMSEQYSKYRPTYPDASIDYILKTLKKNLESIADIGAWTWKLSKLFLERWFSVYVIEPNEEMLKQASKELEIIKWFYPILATAEKTTLSDNSMDLIVVWQAFHRFDSELFKKEWKRILKKDGRVALLYNNWDKDYELIQKIDQLSKKYCPWYKGSSWWLSNQELVFKQFFNTYEKVVFPNNYSLTLDNFLWLNFSASYAPKKWDENYKIYLDELTDLFYKYSDWAMLTMPNNTILRIGNL